MCEYTLVPASSLKCGDVIQHQISSGYSTWDYNGVLAGIYPKEYKNMFRTKFGLRILIANHTLKLAGATRLDEFQVSPNTMIWRKNTDEAN